MVDIDMADIDMVDIIDTVDMVGIDSFASNKDASVASSASFVSVCLGLWAMFSNCSVTHHVGRVCPLHVVGVSRANRGAKTG